MCVNPCVCTLGLSLSVRRDGVNPPLWSSLATMPPSISLSPPLPEGSWGQMSPPQIENWLLLLCCQGWGGERRERPVVTKWRRSSGGCLPPFPLGLLKRPLCPVIGPSEREKVVEYILYRWVVYLGWASLLGCFHLPVLEPRWEAPKPFFN